MVFQRSLQVPRAQVGPPSVQLGLVSAGVLGCAGARFAVAERLLWHAACPAGLCQGPEAWPCPAWPISAPLSASISTFSGRPSWNRL